MLTSFFASCNHFYTEDDDDDDESTETVVTRYSYNLSSNDSYYIVREYNCVDIGNSTYRVKNYAVHYFSNSQYGKFYGKTGSELISIVQIGSYYR